MRLTFILFSALATIPLASMSQTINTTFYDPNSVQGKKVTVIPHQPGTSDDEIIFTSNYTGTSGTQLLIVKTDNQGNFMQATLQNHELANHHIVTTYDDGFLVAGSPDPTKQDYYLIVMKYDNNLNLQWAKKIPLRARTYFAQEEIDIATSTESGKEFYYIACNEANPNPGFEQESSFSVVKIDENGVLNWHHTYALAGQTGGNFYHGATAIVRYQDQGQNLFCIAGNQVWGASNFSFYMAIDETGHIVHQLRHHHSNHYVFNPDLVWDGTNLVFIDTDFNPNQLMPCTTAPVISVFKLNPDLTQILDPGTLQPIEYYYFYACDHNLIGAQGITLDPAGNYVISYSYEENGIYHAGYIALDPVTVTMISYSHTTYNALTSMQYDRQEHFTDIDGNNYFVPSVLPGGTLSPRLMKADLGYNNCGVNRPNFLRRFVTSSGEGSFPHTTYEREEIYHYDVMESPYNLSQDFCSNAPDPDQYRIPAGSAATTAEVYPKLVRRSNQEINCKFNSATQGVVEIAIYNLNGQLMYRQHQSVVKGQNLFTINAKLAPGVNILNISSGGKIIKTEKMVFAQ